MNTRFEFARVYGKVPNHSGESERWIRDGDQSRTIGLEIVANRNNHRTCSCGHEMRQIPFVAEEADILGVRAIKGSDSSKKISQLAAYDVSIDKRSEFGKT